MVTRFLFLCLGLVTITVATADDAIDSVRELTYEKDIRPILKVHCFQCHGDGEELGGELDLRLRRLIVKGGESGPAFVPSDQSNSLLFERMSQGEMPPEDVELRPTRREVELIGRWIASGAKTARDEPDNIDPSTYITEEERNFWSFQPIRRPSPPAVKQTERVRSPIDLFVLAKLEANNLSFAADADRQTLLRRAYFDLTGLPPSPKVMRQFLDDQSPEAYGRLIDRLLNSPHYGERWGRHWLDVAGYADSEGYTDADAVRPDAWKYRDYVIRSLNADKPFDQFIVEQLAGDELISWPETASLLAKGQAGSLSRQEVEEMLAATGFLRMAPDGTGAGATDQNLARNEVVAKTVEIVSTSLLGLSVACAQCHNHRYDPIPQQDYYRVRAIFDPAYDWKNWLAPNKRRVSLYTDTDREKAKQVEAEAKTIEAERKKKEAEYIQQTFDLELAKLPSELHEPIRQARNTPVKKRTAAQSKLLKENPSVNVSAGSLYLYDRKAADDLKAMAAKASKLRTTKPKEEFIRALWEPAGKTPPKSFVFSRGDHEQAKQEVSPAELTVLTSFHKVEVPTNDESLSSTGRRLAYARWLTSGEHPLVARVLVNRVWLNHFGRGIVGTPGDFGFLGTRPSHPELLDWLASEFVEQGWSLKKLHRLIMTSTVYRQASRRSPAQDEIDAENRLYARASVRRLEAEVLRDSVLSIAGQLNLKPNGPAVPVMADRVGQFIIGKENLNAGRPGAVVPMKGEEFRRSVYIQVRRSRPLSVLEPFDLPRMEPNCTSRNTSTVAPQSLLLMNSQFLTTHAMNFACRVQAELGDDRRAQAALAWQLAFADEPSDEDIDGAVRFLTEQTEHFAAHPLPVNKKKKEKTPSPQLEALASFCHALLSSSKCLYVD